MRKVEVTLEYQDLIESLPVQPADLYKAACSRDEPTIDYWQHQWLGNITANKQRFGSFAENSCAIEFQKYRYLPAIVAGSGPSLKVNAAELKERGGIPLVSCLHNFHYFEDQGIVPEYYVSLDAGHVTVEEVSEGGSRTPAEYWAITKDRTLIAYIGSHPDLLAKWQGKILFFNVPVPRPELEKKIDAVEDFGVMLSTGGNVLGACVYFAKAILGCHQTVFIGADFSFGYERSSKTGNNKFHAWDSKYDEQMGQVVRVMDIYGNKVSTWPSYYGFKQYFDSLPARVPGIYYNCTEGGCLGAYNEGNFSGFKYMDLKDCLKQFKLNEALTDIMKNPTAKPRMLFYS